MFRGNDKWMQFIAHLFLLSLWSILSFIFYPSRQIYSSWVGVISNLIQLFTHPQFSSEISSNLLSRPLKVVAFYCKHFYCTSSLQTKLCSEINITLCSLIGCNSSVALIFLLHTFTMDSLVWAMSEITPSEMMRRMKYSEPSFINDAYLRKRQSVLNKYRITAIHSITYHFHHY